MAPYLSLGSVVIADDIQENSAFGDWIAQIRPGFRAIVREETKDALFGVCVATSAITTTRGGVAGVDA